MPTLYRKRLIPDECVNLKNDNIIFLDSDAIVTSWNTFRPKAEFTHGTSYYVINEGFKISKFYKADNSLASIVTLLTLLMMLSLIHIYSQIFLQMS